MSAKVIIRDIETTKARHNIALLGEETQQQLSLRVQEVSPGEGTPLHLHNEQAETFHVVDGEFLFQVGDTKVHGKPGLSVHIPKGTPHCFLYPDTGQRHNGKLISVLTPGIHDGFINEIPKAESNGASSEELSQLAEQHGAKILGPKITAS